MTEQEPEMVSGNEPAPMEPSVSPQNRALSLGVLTGQVPVHTMQTMPVRIEDLEEPESTDEPDPA